MKIHACEQGDRDWLNLRAGRPTASEFGRFMTSRFEYRDGEMPKTYLYEKVAEAILKHALPSGSSWATEQGQILEGEARAWYQLETGDFIRQVGFIEAEDGGSGCSPDGLCEASGYGLELKAPFPQTHLRYLDENRVPLDYITQVHGSMFVTGFSEWRFASYSRGLPALMLTVPRDEEVMGKIAGCIAKFHANFLALMARVTDRK